MSESTIKVGVGVMLMKGNKVLLSKRKGSHGAGEFAFPGGHLEFGESFEECARREVSEETGIEIKNIRFQCLANIKKYGDTHYVQVGLIADWKSGQPRNLEPEKSGEWNWYSLDKLPEPVFEMCRLSFYSYKNGRDYFDS